MLLDPALSLLDGLSVSDLVLHPRTRGHLLCFIDEGMGLTSRKSD